MFRCCREPYDVCAEEMCLLVVFDVVVSTSSIVLWWKECSGAVVGSARGQARAGDVITAACGRGARHSKLLDFARLAWSAVVNS